MANENITAYPLQWPGGWPRKDHISRKNEHPFYRRTGDNGRQEAVTFDYARRSLTEELNRLGAKTVTLSSNVPIRGDDHPYSDAARRRMDDPGVAVYFMLKGRPFVMAQDRYYDVAANTRSLALAIEGMRQMERHGGATMMERAFEGFAQLPPPAGGKPKRPWFEVLRYKDPDERELLSETEVKARFASIAKMGHSDRGGTLDMDELTTARDEALEAIKGGL